MKREGVAFMAFAHHPKYVLRLADLPKIVQSDKAVYPVFMTPRDAARLFGVDYKVLLGWGEKYGLPLVKFGNKTYIEVAAFNDWIRANSQPREARKERPA